MKLFVIIFLLSVHSITAGWWSWIYPPNPDQLTKSVTLPDTHYNTYQLIARLDTISSASKQLQELMIHHQFLPTEQLVTTCTQNQQLFSKLKARFQKQAECEEQRAAAHRSFHLLTLSASTLFSINYLLQQAELVAPTKQSPLSCAMLGFLAPLVIGEIELGIEQAVVAGYAATFGYTPKGAHDVLNMIAQCEQTIEQLQRACIEKLQPDEDAINFSLSDSGRLRGMSLPNLHHQSTTKR